VRELPSGTVTFLFTDIEGSTTLLHELGDDYADELAEHRRVLREAFGRHGGVEVDTQGDAFFVAFARAADALEAAREGQAGLDGPIRVRMGVHTGEPLVTEEGYVGLDVHRAARIAAVGHGGQVLVSSATAALLPSNNLLLDLGEHRLKDLTAPERIYQLGDGEFPPLKSLNQSNLPEQPTPFVGREKELGEVLRLLGDERIRLLTLTGAGGSGKTRLAVQAAAERVEDYEHGVWWVGLQAIREPKLVSATIAAAIGAGRNLAQDIAQRRMLLLLDNFEQVVDAAPVLPELLMGCPNLSLLVTSREPLRLAAEREFVVPPFDEQEGVDFFLGRAQAVRADFQPDDHVREICNRLDQLPLALELAAARVRALSSAQILERLDQRLPLLIGGSRDVPERQRTLRATIGWSYELLSPEEQQVFRRLAVFSGGCTLESVEPVAKGDLDSLQSFVEKSLLRFARERYSMLETIREFALEQLEGCGEAEETHRRHAGFFLALAESTSSAAEADYGGDYNLPADQDNFRAAIDWSLATGEIEQGLRIAISLELFWVINDPWEGARRFEALLAVGGGIDSISRARALRCYGACTFSAGDFQQSVRLLEESLALFKEAGDAKGAAVPLYRLAMTRAALNELGSARPLLEESLELFRQVGSRRGEAEGIGAAGYVAQREGNLQRAAELYGESAQMASEVGFTWLRREMLLSLAGVELQLGRTEEAEPHARESLRVADGLGDRGGVFWGLVFLAWAASVRDDAERAGLLWGAVEAEEKRGPVGQWEGERETYAARILAVDGPQFARAREQGQRLPFDRAVEEALA
jgi:predicted ATPase